MAKQSFTAEQREALWVAHNKKCVYTRELLDVSNFHIDHVIPENIFLDPGKYRVVKPQLGLTDDFDPTGYENLLPCKSGANLQKGGKAFDPAPAHFFLDVAAKKTNRSRPY